ncbi:MAG: site-2 protease family protein [Ruminiclostridium sp.]
MISVGKLNLKFNFSFFAVIAFLIFADTSGMAVLSLTACILHEVGHLLAMALCGIYPDKITFYGGGIAIDKLGMEQISDGRRLFILSAGCTVNFLISSIYLFAPENEMIQVFSAVNLLIGIFNALPIGYFDGARILQILLVRIMRPSAATIVKKIIGVLCSTLIIAGIVYYCVFSGKTVSISLAFAMLYLIIAQFVG